MAENAERGDLPLASVAPKKRRRVSVIWIIPILAAAVAIGIAVQRVMNEGPTITIVFKEASGIEAGKTFVKFKDVNVGQVTTVQLSEDFTRVTVTAKVAKSAAGLLVEDTKFWVVEPRISLSGVSGLGTLLSGNYIGVEVGQSTRTQRGFTGLEVPPPISRDQPGRHFTLKADSLGSLSVGSPVIFRRLQAGQVVAYNLVGDGKSVEIKVFVNAPFDQYVHPETRFWNASGIEVSVGANGVEVRTESLAAILAGGLAFETPSFAPAVGRAAADAIFTLFADRTTAMKQPPAITVRYVLYPNETLRGLSVGAPVALLGLTVGEVTNIGFDYDAVFLRLRGRVEIAVYPERSIALFSAGQAVSGGTSREMMERRRALMTELIENRGLRVQLRSGSLITGQRFVAFDYFPDAPEAKLDWSQDPVELPVVPSTFAELEAKLDSILTKVDNLPFEAIGADVKKTLETLNQTLKDVDKAVNRLDASVTPEIRKVIEDARKLLAEVGVATASADKMIKNADATLVGPNAPGQQELRNALQEIARAARSFRVLADYLERNPDSLLRGKPEGKP